MILPVITALVIVFIVWINYEIHKTSKVCKDDTEKFWNRENVSNRKPRSDISSLDYIIITTDQLPTLDSLDQTVNSYRDIICGLSGKKALNSSHYTNTELKFRYGAANIGLLTEYDSNYTVLVSILHKWAKRLYDLGDKEASLTILEYALSCHTDVAKSYLLLAELYKQNSDSEKIIQLAEAVSQTHIRNKEVLINKLLDLSKQ
jgi:tetratricopeptide (TPR) repeat protein